MQGNGILFSKKVTAKQKDLRHVLRSFLYDCYSLKYDLNFDSPDFLSP